MKKLDYIWIFVLCVIGGNLLSGCDMGGSPGSNPDGTVTVNIGEIPGIVPPFTGQMPKYSITATTQYTGTIKWTPDDASFKEGEIYTASITLTVKKGFTFEGVSSDFFTVVGATSVHNQANSGIVTAIFPAAAIGVIFDPDNGGELIYQNIQIGEKATAPTGVKKYIDSIDINSLKTAGLYVRQLELLGWYQGNTKFDFDSPITESIFLKAKWSETPGPISTVPANNVAAAVTYIKENVDEYLLLISADVNCESQTLNNANLKLMIAGIGKEQKISLSSYGYLFYLGGMSSSGCELTLGNNITLVGRTSGVNGAATNNNSNLVAVTNGSSFKMLPGSKITGNTSTSTTAGYDAAVRISGSGSSFIMQGGTITGNMGLESSADVYIDYGITAYGFKLSGSAAIGTLTLNASSSSFAYPTIVSGWTGSVNKLNLRGGNASLDTVKTYWEERIIIESDDDYFLTEGDLAKFKLGDFISSASTDNTVAIADSHYLGNSGWLLKNGTGLNILLSRNGGLAKEYIDLNRALNAITEPGNYLVTLKTDFEITPRVLNTNGVKITLIGADTEKKISIDQNVSYLNVNIQNGILFTVGASGRTDIGLTLGNNITLVGRTNGVNGAAENANRNLVIVNNGASFAMLPGSKITGNTYISVENTYGFGAAVHVTGVGSSFDMQGGIVTGNTGGNGNADVFISANASGLTISGNAHIGSLILTSSSSPIVCATANIASGWTGSIGKLDLGSSSSSVSTNIGNWYLREVFKEAEGHTITGSDIGKVTLGNFLFGFSPYSQPIGGTHFLYSTGQLFLNESVHTVNMSRDDGRNLCYPNLNIALSIISTFGDYTITVLENQDFEPPNNGNQHGRMIDTNGANVTIVSPDAEKTIKIVTRQCFMFTVSGKTTSLTLGNNITLVGFTAGVNGTMDNNSGLVEVMNGATFTMLPGSKIKENTSFSSSYGSAVTVNQSTFIMKGGEITGNVWSYQLGYLAGGVALYESDFFMEGGSITGNYGPNGIETDIRKSHDSKIVLSGDAQIGAILMYSYSLDDVEPVTITSGWTGGGSKFHLYHNISSIPSLISFWENRRILQPAEGYALTTADTEKFSLGLWVTYDTSVKQVIDGHEISDTGVIVPKS